MIGKSLGIPSSSFRDSLSFRERTDSASGSNDNYLFESVNRRIIDRRLSSPLTVSFVRGDRPALSLSLSPEFEASTLIAPCNNYPRSHRVYVNHDKELSHRGGSRERRFTFRRVVERRREADYGDGFSFFERQGFHDEGMFARVAIGHDRVEGRVNCVFLLDKRSQRICLFFRNFLGYGVGKLCLSLGKCIWNCIIWG